MGSGSTILVVALLAGAVFLYVRSKEESVGAVGDPDVVTGSVGESKSSVCSGGCMSTGCKKCVKCGSSKCHNPKRNICYNCSTQSCGRCPSVNKISTKGPIFQAKKSPNQTSKPALSTPNFARGGGNQTITKPRIVPGQTTSISRPRYVANKVLRTRCVTRPYSKENYWYCTFPNGRSSKAGRDYRCKGLLARYQNVGHICYP